MYPKCPLCKTGTTYVMALKEEEMYIMCDNKDCDFDKGPIDSIDKLRAELDKLKTLEKETP